MRSFIILFCALFLWSSCSGDHPEKPNPTRRKSPTAIAKINHSDTYIKIVYGQPYKKGRTIFGDLVPYGKVWRTGANEATELTTTRPITFNKEKVAAGTYALFTIPGRKKWTIILNDSLGQWGAFDYSAAHDVLRTQVAAQSTDEVTEAFTLRFGNVKNNTTSIDIRWDTTLVMIPITFEATDSTLGS